MRRLDARRSLVRQAQRPKRFCDRADLDRFGEREGQENESREREGEFCVARYASSCLLSVLLVLKVLAEAGLVRTTMN